MVKTKGTTNSQKTVIDRLFYTIQIVIRIRIKQVCALSIIFGSSLRLYWQIGAVISCYLCALMLRTNFYRTP